MSTSGGLGGTSTVATRVWDFPNFSIVDVGDMFFQWKSLFSL